MSASHELTLTLGDWSTQREHAQWLRMLVFVEEQKVPVELELDDMDPVSQHALAWKQGTVIGTARLLPDGHIGRMAVLASARRKGVGSSLLQALMEQARSAGLREVVLHAQLHARDFYARHGFTQRGDVFDEAGIPHVEMRAPL